MDNISYSELDIFLDDKETLETPTVHRFGNTISLQFNGWAIVFLNDGGWYVDDTSGG